MSTRTARYSVGGSLTSQLSSTKIPSNSPFKIGKVMGTIMDDNTPNNELFIRDGGWGGIGTIYYVNYPTNKTISNINLSKLSTAIPFLPNQKYIPLKGELVLIFDLPSPQTQDNSRKTQKYYLSVLNLWNNNHHNAQLLADETLGKTFFANANIKALLPFEGDSIFEGRVGNSLRFTSTTKFNNKENFWSLTGNDGDPITLLTNGHNFSPDSLKPYVENINGDGSSLYLTSTQKIPINTRSFTYNLLFNPIKPNSYFNSSQAMLSGDRIIINAKKDEVLIYGKGIGLSSYSSIYLNSDIDIILDAPKINLGLSPSGAAAVEPILLGDQTISMLSSLIKELKSFCTSLKTVETTPVGTPLIDVTLAAKALYTGLEDITTITDNLKKLKSTKSYTV
jgi:hypothetical protein